MTRFIRLLCLALACFALSACYERHEWRQKLTVVVDTPDGQVSGSAVVQVNATYYGQLPATGTEVGYEVSGEAVVVEVSTGKYLFALLDMSGERYYQAAKQHFDGSKRRDWLREVADQTVIAQLEGEYLPRFATFTDISDLTTFQRITEEDFSRVFGSGVQLNTAYLEITDDPVSSGELQELLSPLIVSWRQLQGLEPLQSSGSTSNPEAFANVPLSELISRGIWRSQ
ncbi:MAG: hypothetical protein AAFU41_07580 [Pseudomonadota bacterium]